MSFQSNSVVSNEADDSPARWSPAAVLSWINLLSLDAVAVGLVWQAVFTHQFCQRWPQGYENAILGLSIWLAYTADRLMDACRLDRSLLHTLRHEIHHEYHRRFCIAWLIALTINIALIVSQATESQLRVGFVAIGLVLAYLAGVHLRPRRLTHRNVLPKELQIGVVFAFGASLNGWASVSPDDRASLGLLMIMLAPLFSLNCLAVASLEAKLDAQQGFPSLVNRHPWSSRWLPSMLFTYAAITLVLGVMNWIPTLFAISLCLSSVGLFFAVRWQPRFDNAVTTRTESLRLAVSCLAADTVIIVAPSAWMLSSFLS